METEQFKWSTYLLGSEEHRDYLLSQYRSVMDFIERFLPDYYTNPQVLETDLLWRYIGDEELSPEDEKLYKEQFPDKKKALSELIEVESEILRECVEAFYNKYFYGKVNNV
jgi:hypothetical protein